MQGLNWIAILISTIISMGIGFIWHGPIFGKIWINIHYGGKKMNEAELKESMKGMWKLLFTEFISSLLMVIGLACVIRAIPEYSGIRISFMVWISFVLPVMTSTVIWGGDHKKWMCSKIAISSSARLVSLLIAGYILTL